MGWFICVFLDVRVIVLNCEVTYARHVMKQATQKGMTSSEWAWVVTDGVTSSVIYYS